MAKWVKNLTNVHEDAGAIPSPIRWFKDPTVCWSQTQLGSGVVMAGA